MQASVITFFKRQFAGRSCALARLPFAFGQPLSIIPQVAFSPRCSLGKPSDTPAEGPPLAMADEAAPPLAPPGLSRTFYKRDLPCPPATAFSSPEGQAIFR